MNRWNEVLRRVHELNAAVKPNDAQAALTQLIAQCSDEELVLLGSRIESAITTFLPKRQRRLNEVLRERRERRTAPAEVLAVEQRPEAEVPATDEPSTQRASSPSINSRLSRIEHLNRAVQPRLAEAEFRELLQSLDPAELSRHVRELRVSIASFLPKRQRLLTEILDAGLREADREIESDGVVVGPELLRTPVPASRTRMPAHVVPAPGTARPRPGPPATDGRAVSGVTRQRVPLAYSKNRLSEELEDLGNRHIFQWATCYRDVLSRYFDDFLVELGSCDRPGPWLNLMKASLSHHAAEIFRRGYVYQTENNVVRPHYAITKSLTGLQRFLDLPLEFYSARLAEAHHASAARSLRQLCSAMASGILIGYSNTKFDQIGSNVLPRFSGAWVHVLPFLTSEDLRELMGNLQAGLLLDGIHDSVLPFARALDLLLTKDPDAAPLPALSQYSDSNRRLEISLQLPPKAAGSRRIEVLCYLDERHVDRLLIEEAAGRAVGVVIAPLRADLRIELLAIERLSDIVVPTGGLGEEPQTRLVALLEDLLYETNSASGNRPIDFNYAAEFPLESPFLSRYSHVYRTSVRRLMQSFERRNGVRLWCSVRRSGKTTACSYDLGSTSAQSVVVAQTCDPTGQIADGGAFYRKIQQALDSGRRLQHDFVEVAVTECLVAQPDVRVILVLDEYETLFGALRTAMEKDPGIRYTVVQPLLNQLVSFTRDNLLIFVGQRPDAHWILTDQNQLSPVVIHDPFPLFDHGPASRSVSEFDELVRKIMSGHVDLDPEFIDRVYAETGGHPFLTGKLLVSFWAWLIENQRPASSLAPARPQLFMEFTESCLGHRSIAQNYLYEMFRKAAADHLSPVGREKEPWLHAVYSVLRNLVLSSPESFSVPHHQFVELAERTGDLVSPEDLLSTASRANFLVHQDGMVRPRIPLLGRIAAAVRAT
ncbi:hypothetical protein IU459_31585 [Nocardia amamiensis]|uniref:Uncharacterized protein n=1 Tax=Nocardia amamiensis TaxID=404578 RepID=A0ABS0D4G1_9NOCA|nr:hypothetical protein [Nocardia amamiensis]MBF6302054.1 hypothetical protein [Nocardia amamiensis]